MWLGLCLLTQNLWFTISFILIYWVYYERIMFAEEAFLTKKFGDTYLEWASRRPLFCLTSQFGNLQPLILIGKNTSKRKKWYNRFIFIILVI